MATSKIKKNKILLWENNGTENVSPQTINLDLSPYDEVEILCTRSATDDTDPYTTVRSPVDVTSKMGKLVCSIWELDTSQSGYATLTLFYRQFYISNNAVGIGSGYMFYRGARYDGWNNRCVPRRIYGIKY